MPVLRWLLSVWRSCAGSIATRQKKNAPTAFVSTNTQSVGVRSMYYEGAVYATEAIGKRAGVRYCVTLSMLDGEMQAALVYMRWNEISEASEMYCYFHKAADCQCVQAVKSVQASVGLGDKPADEGYS